MAVSPIHLVQCPTFSSRGRVFFPSPDRRREISKTMKNCRLVFASAKESDKDLCLDSKAWNDFCLIILCCPNYYLPEGSKRLKNLINHLSKDSSILCDISRCASVEKLLDNVKWDDKGLAVAIAQNIDTGAILMQGFVNRDALATTISSRKATFYSRSRSSLWTKGETSKNFINIHDIFLDCDSDSIIYLGKPDGPTCHTGSETCYYTSVNDYLDNKQASGSRLALTTLSSLESIISKRKAELTKLQDGKPSWTKRLLQNNELLCSKIREEADELCRTLEENEHSTRTASEMGDVIYHAMVLLALKDVKIEDVIETLRHRFSQSGIEEKKNRQQ